MTSVKCLWCSAAMVVTAVGAQSYRAICGYCGATGPSAPGKEAAVEKYSSARRSQVDAARVELQAAIEATPDEANYRVRKALGILS